MNPKSFLVDLKVNESLAIGDGVTVTLEHKSGQLARLRFQHDGVDIRRTTPDRRSSVRGANPGRRSTDGQQ